ncbi:MAG: PEP/pyruvate-binding domain-containing protein [Candidatus Binatia bacterium]|nr:PEP/pyruvate-binding domain-containing protein [Candidatus Binatia bacterium]
MARILKIDETGDHAVGGKAEGLARLRAMGLEIPPTLVLEGAVRGGLPEDLEREVAVLGEGRLAVRSSAIGEDGAGASFAGQYETILDVRPTELRSAIDQCLASAQSARAVAYRDSRDEAAGAAVMSVVIQRMVSARASGVCFTADPVTSRRNRLVLDSVAGLGEALVSGHASPDHDELRRSDGVWEPTQLAGATPVLSQEERAQLAREALEAETAAGEPLDLEWAIDVDGTLFWLQARPITTLMLDPQSIDTPPMEEGDVYTRCNVGEMMPGAVSPLTFSTCARGIDVGWQDNMIAIGVRAQRSSDNVYIGMSHGHLFINLSEGARFSSAVTGSHPDQQSLAICGRLVPEIVAPDVPALRIRLPRAVRQVASVVRAQPHLRRMEALVERGTISVGGDSKSTWQNIEAEREVLYESYARHLTVSSGAGALAPILLRVLAGDAEPSPEHHAAVGHLLSGAEGVESADIAAGARRLLEALERSATPAEFPEWDVATAVAWFRGEASGEAGCVYTAYLARHGHRSLRELDVRQPEWAHDPTPLIRALQAQLRARRVAGSASVGAEPVRVAMDLGRLRWLAPMAHAAVRNRERSKSLLVATTVHFKRAYRALAAQFVAEGRLPDEDAVFFLLHEELGLLAESSPGDRWADLAVQRREALSFQEKLRFPEVSVGLPEPEAPPPVEGDERLVVGKPVSRGRVEGRVRVVRELVEAEALEPGEILVAAITDVGWTPYFAIIAGLVTDVGSAVSHGAVVAREYGLPAVLNTGNATRVLRTGDRVRLDGDAGTVEVMEPAV